MTQPTRIRAQMAGSGATVRVLMSHEMASGQARDAAGQPIPAFFIQEVTVHHNGRRVLSADWGGGVSRNPFLQFTLKNAAKGDRIGVSWKDNQGNSRTDEAAIA